MPGRLPFAIIVRWYYQTMRLGLSRDSTALKIMALQLGARRDCLYIRVQGRFAQKGTLGAAAVAQVITEEAAEAVAHFRWRPVPRARVAVEMRFFAVHSNIPDLHHLVKFYLDPLRGVAFTDDRQVACLVAASWKPPRGFGEDGKRDQNTVSIKVERFVDCVRRFDLWHALSDHPGFPDRIGDDDEDQYRVSADDRRLDDSWLDALDLPEEVRVTWRRLKLMDFQKGLLAGNRIDWMDRPGGAPGPLAKAGFLWKRQSHPLLFTLDVRRLPGFGESSEFREDTRAQMRAVAQRWGDRGRFIIPVELDVQVPEESGGTPTDLDNVMRRYIAPALGQELLKPPDGYLHAYRIYRVKRVVAEDRAISLRMLPEGAIQRFEERMERTLKAGQEWLTDRVWRY